jgi:FkbM family methyltransferase
MKNNIIRRIVRSLGVDVVKYPYYVSYREQKHYQQLLSHYEIDLIFDVGANIGQYASEVFQHGYTGKIVSFEPMSKEYQILSLASNSNPNWIVAPQMAIGAEEGFIDFNISENSVSSSILKANDYGLGFDPTIQYVAREQVRLATLSGIFKEYSQSAKNIFLKIDVQGYEEQVILGAADVMGNFKGIHTEFSLKPLYEGEKEMVDIFDLISSFGFRPHYFLPHISIDSIGRLMQIDGVFYK